MDSLSTLVSLHWSTYFPPQVYFLKISYESNRCNNKHFKVKECIITIQSLSVSFPKVICSKSISGPGGHPLSPTSWPFHSSSYTRGLESSRWGGKILVLCLFFQGRSVSFLKMAHPLDQDSSKPFLVNSKLTIWTLMKFVKSIHLCHILSVRSKSQIPPTFKRKEFTLLWFSEARNLVGHIKILPTIDSSVQCLLLWYI